MVGLKERGLGDAYVPANPGEKVLYESLDYLRSADDGTLDWRDPDVRDDVLECVDFIRHDGRVTEDVRSEVVGYFREQFDCVLDQIDKDFPYSSDMSFEAHFQRQQLVDGVMRYRDDTVRQLENTYRPGLERDGCESILDNL